VLGGDAVEGVLEATGGLGVDVVLDFVGEHGTPGTAIDIVRQGGTYLVVGYGGTLDIETMSLVLKEVRIEGNLVGNHGDFAGLMSLVGAGKVHLHTQDYALDDAAKALDDLDNGRVKGRAVLRPNAR
jgi:NAD+-dependent secondary alcohol dehydrogenase Adh1